MRRRARGGAQGGAARGLLRAHHPRRRVHDDGEHLPAMEPLRAASRLRRERRRGVGHVRGADFPRGPHRARREAGRAGAVGRARRDGRSQLFRIADRLVRDVDALRRPGRRRRLRHAVPRHLHPRARDTERGARRGGTRGVRAAGGEESRAERHGRGGHREDHRRREAGRQSARDELPPGGDVRRAVAQAVFGDVERGEGVRGGRGGRGAKGVGERDRADSSGVVADVYGFRIRRRGAAGGGVRDGGRSFRRRVFNGCVDGRISRASFYHMDILVLLCIHSLAHRASVPAAASTSTPASSSFAASASLLSPVAAAAPPRSGSRASPPNAGSPTLFTVARVLRTKSS
mmetsp:Transcript_5302/g.19096  ORF Transcript_5302/g.19096 Transcript_5302/m.19096 type:complete len:346 (-) Transcript_5302:316-1353(-)